MKRIILAFLTAPIVPAVVQILTFNQGGEYHPLAYFVLFSGALYALQLVVVLPGYLVLRHRGKRHEWWSYALLGFFGATIPLLVGASISGPRPDFGLFQAVWLSAHLGLLGAADAAIFWFIARPNGVDLRKSDVSAPPTVQEGR